MKKKQKIVVLCIALFAFLGMLTGCQKEFWDYNCVWVSEKPYIYMPAKEHYVNIEIDGIMYNLDGAWANDGTGITFYNPNIDGGLTEEAVVWDTTCKIKNGELYLTIIVDNVSDYEGKTIVLHQEPLETVDESVSSEEITSEADTTDYVEKTEETEPDTETIISCDDFEVDLLSKETIGDYNIYIPLEWIIFITIVMALLFCMLMIQKKMTLLMPLIMEN